MTADAIVGTENVPDLSVFYFLGKTFSNANPIHRARRQQVLDLMAQYRSLTQDSSVCGEALEDVVWSAVNLAPAGLYLPVGSQRHPVIDFGRVTLPGYLDFTLLLLSPGTYLVAGEAKNIRHL